MRKKASHQAIDRLLNTSEIRNLYGFCFFCWNSVRIGLIISAIAIGGDVHNFINAPGLMIVFGGTVATTLLTFQFKDVINAYRAAYFVFSQGKADSNTMVETMIKLCHLSRRVGVLELGEIKTIKVGRRTLVPESELQKWLARKMLAAK